MSLFKRILCPVDFSEISSSIVPYVKSLAEKYDADVHVLFVARLFKYFENIYVPAVSIRSFEDNLCKGARKRLDEFVQEHLKEMPNVTAEVIPGDPSQEIIKYIENEGIDLVVIGTHGRKGLDHIVFGSVAEHVVKNSPVPVVSVNPYRGKAK